MPSNKRRSYVFLFALFFCCLFFCAAEIFSFYFLEYADAKNGLFPIRPDKRQPSFAWASDPFIFTGSIHRMHMGWDSLSGAIRDWECNIENNFVSSYGDSFTYCAELPSHQSWEACVSDLNKKPFINLGVRGYGPDQAFVKMKKNYDLFSSNIVVLGVLPEASRKVLSRVRNYYFSDPCKPVCKTRFLYVSNPEDNKESDKYEFIDGFDIPVSKSLVPQESCPAFRLVATPYSFFTDERRRKQK